MKDKVSNDRNEMTFLEHLEELRWYIIRCIIALLIGMFVCYFFSETLLSAVTKSVPKGVILRTLRPTEGFVVRLKLAFTGGFFAAIPYILFQVWRFVAPGLLDNEKRYVFPFMFFGSLVFFIGGFFAYSTVLPTALGFLHSFQTDTIHDAWAIGDFITFVTRLLVSFGVIFELPVVTFIFTKLGLITPQMLSSKRRYAILIIFIVAAVLTPPDVFTQLMMAGPLILLYEISIIISKFAVPKTKHTPAH